MAPAYLQNMLTTQRGRYAFRSTESMMLMIPKTKFKTRGDRSFAAPKLRNNLPVQVRKSPDIETFKSRLKTHLFYLTTAFNQ